MKRDEEAAIDALDRQLDALVRRTPVRPTDDGEDVTLAATAAELQYLFLGDPVATPSSDFLRQLENQLMEHAEPAQSCVTTAGQLSVMSRRLFAALYPATANPVRTRRGWRPLAAVAIVLLTITAGFGAIRLLPQHDSTPRLPAYGMAPGATPTAGEAGCAAGGSRQASSSSNPATAAASLPAGTTVPGVGKPVLPGINPNQGQPADAATVDAIKQSVKQLGNCISGDATQSAGGQASSDSQSTYSSQGQENASAGNSQQSESATSSEVTPEVSNVRLLPDGRVGATLSTVSPNNPPHETYVIFRHVGDKWQLDEVVPLVTSQAYGEHGAESSGTPVP